MDGHRGRGWNSPPYFPRGSPRGSPFRVGFHGSPSPYGLSPGSSGDEASPRGGMRYQGPGPYHSPLGYGLGRGRRFQRRPFYQQHRYSSPIVRGHSKSFLQRVDRVRVDDYFHPSMLEDPWKDFDRQPFRMSIGGRKDDQEDEEAKPIPQYWTSTEAARSATQVVAKEPDGNAIATSATSDVVPLEDG